MGYSRSFDKMDKKARGLGRKEELKDIVFFEISKYSVITMILAIVIDILGHYFSGWINMPIWFDNVGISLVAIQFGPLAGVIVGVVSQLFYGIPSGIPPIYLISGASTALVVGFLFPRKTKAMFEVITVAILAAMVATLTSFPLNLYYFKGYTGNAWGDALHQMLALTVNSEYVNAFLSESFIDLPDRVVSVILALLLVDIERNRIYFQNNKKAKKKSKDILTLFLALGLVLAISDTVKAYDFESNYESVTYGPSDGIATAEVNAIAQTDDGFIWVGTYAGVYKYNGVRFETADIDPQIKNATVLFVDSRKMLWIGTNDSGVFCYDLTAGESTRYSTENGLDADSIRAICEDNEGNIFVGTVRSVSRISPEGVVKTYSEFEDLTYSTGLEGLNDGSVLGVTNGGTFFRIKDDTLIFTEDYKEEEGVYFKTVAAMKDTILVSTTGNTVIKYKLVNDKPVKTDSFNIPDHEYINKIVYSHEHEGIFYCAENGFGFVDTAGYKATDLTIPGFDGSTSDVLIDKQGNIWFSSSKQGLMKYSNTPFHNIFKEAGIDKAVVNSVLKDGDLLYAGTDSGMVIIDLKTKTKILRSWLSRFDKVRVRHIMMDSKGNLWISTYGPDGLVKIDREGEAHSFNEGNGMLGGRMRSSLELSDGRILVASNIGLTFLKDDKVDATIGESNGINNQYILSMCEREDGSILAASDGDGIYIIKDNRVVGHIGAPEGLTSAVVMRIVKGSLGYFYVTSNALFYDDGNEVRELTNFTYPNNFDIMIDKKGTCYITSSAGLYLVSEETLIKDEDYVCSLLNNSWGLNTTFTSNSWNLQTVEGFYLCCTDGVRFLSLTEYEDLGQSYQIQLESITTSESTIKETDGRFEIPAKTGRIAFNIAINNYSLTNPLVHYYLEGSRDKGITCYQNEITPLEFTNLGYGKYILHVQILDEATGKVEREEKFTVLKQAMMYEKLYFRTYLLFIGALVAFYIVWLFYTITKRASRIRGLQLEMSTDPMTGLYNKAASERLLSEACKDETGILMMIDLDSFKLVNDIYGHDMGDKILVRFGELITEALGEDNIGGRLGGDEFIGFIRDTFDEDDVDRITKHLNKEIVKSAKEYMGNDMNIPLGASVGAVRVTSEEKDFNKLFRNADKALYIVKQNGKHGYSFFQKGKDSGENDENGAGRDTLSQVKKIIGERNEGKGAYLVNFDRLQAVYRFLCRDKSEDHEKSKLVRIRIISDDGGRVPDEVKDSFEDILVTGLKRNDVVSRYSGHFFVIIVGELKGDHNELIESMITKWKESGDYDKFRIRAEMEDVG